MADLNRERSAEERVGELDIDAAPDPVGVYERPEKSSPVAKNVAILFAIFLLLVIAYFALTAIL